jgi:hypothetical protein
MTSRSRSLTIAGRDRDDSGMPTSFILLQTASEKESAAIRDGEVAVTREQAEAWCALHVNDNWRTAFDVDG